MYTCIMCVHVCINIYYIFETLGLSMEIFKYEYKIFNNNNKPIVIRYTLIVFRFCNICSRQSDFNTNRSPCKLLLALSV